MRYGTQSKETEKHVNKQQKQTQSYFTAAQVFGFRCTRLHMQAITWGRHISYTYVCSS